MHDALWLGVDLATGIMHHGPDYPLRDAAARFAASFHGMPGEAFADVIDDLFALSPDRFESRPLLESQLADVLDAGQRRQRAADWRDLVARMAGPGGPGGAEPACLPDAAVDLPHDRGVV
ncbi:MAG: hypothetical protein WD534_08660 [Phycisphaeraceae bacterium]